MKEFPFAALVGQEELKRSLLLSVVNPAIGGVMIMGHRGCAKSTAVRGLADLMPALEAVVGCPYNCAAAATAGLCRACTGDTAPEIERRPIPMVDLPLGATEDRVVGTLDLEAALIEGRRAFDPGLLASANRGFLYIDEVNLLEDHLVDLLLDVAAAGENVVERESISIRHPSRFVLAGSGNPEEGELRPQLLDRFGLFVRIETENDPERRVEIVRRRLAFDADPEGFRESWRGETDALRERVSTAMSRLAEVRLAEEQVTAIAVVNSELEIDGHRGELTMARASRARAAFEGRDEVSFADLRAVARPSLTHRLRRDPLDSRDLGHRIDDVVARRLGD